MCCLSPYKGTNGLLEDSTAGRNSEGESPLTTFHQFPLVAGIISIFFPLQEFLREYLDLRVLISTISFA